MTNDREAILGRVRGALGPLKQRAAYPAYADGVGVMYKVLEGRDVDAVFIERIKLVNGLALEGAPAVADWLRRHQRMHGYCDPRVWPELDSSFGVDFKVETEFDRSRIDTYQFGITCAAGAIAETGAIILKDGTTSSRLAALAPWVHIAVVRRAEILACPAQAIAAFGDDPNIIWCAGPSKTGDIEGILVVGVHGPGQQLALVLA